ncbi:MAG: cyclophilin-like fold protein [Chloroflexota bacterium]|nr:cyclophilin-like fold protein [Chloroflexota bacterium]
MSRSINIKFDNSSFEGVLNDSNTSNLIWDSLPINSSVSTWGDEIYFSIPVSDNEDNSKEVVELGDLGYWPPGNAFCIFFGLTPASSEGEIRPASPVNILGKIIGELDSLKQVKPGESVIISRKD